MISSAMANLIAFVTAYFVATKIGDFFLRRKVMNECFTFAITHALFVYVLRLLISIFQPNFDYWKLLPLNFWIILLAGCGYFKGKYVEKNRERFYGEDTLGRRSVLLNGVVVIWVLLFLVVWCCLGYTLANVSYIRDNFMWFFNFW